MSVFFYRRDSSIPAVKAALDSVDELSDVAKFLEAGDVVYVVDVGHYQMIEDKSFVSMGSSIQASQVDFSTTWTFDNEYTMPEEAIAADADITLDLTGAVVGGAVMAHLTLDGTDALEFVGDGVDITISGDMTTNPETLAAGTYTFVAYYDGEAVRISCALVNEKQTLSIP
jgi:hypothetical protein